MFVPKIRLTLLCLPFLFFIISATSFATELPVRGLARGESKIKPGDQAPLITDDLNRAHQEGKIIALMLGHPAHCPWCDRMDRYIRAIMDETKSFDNKAVFIEVQIEPMKMVQPPVEGPKLKEAYGVEGQPWLFIIDKNGVVRYVYKVFVSSDTFMKDIKGLIEEAEKEKEKGR